MPVSFPVASLDPLSVFVSLPLLELQPQIASRTGTTV
jgi:hypothetical protein